MKRLNLAEKINSVAASATPRVDQSRTDVELGQPATPSLDFNAMTPVASGKPQVQTPSTQAGTTPTASSSPAAPQPAPGLDLSQTSTPTTRRGGPRDHPRQEMLADPTYVDPYVQDNLSPRGTMQDTRENRGSAFISHRDLNMTEEEFMQMATPRDAHPGFWTPEFQNPSEFYKGASTVSKIDFIPSDKDDTLEVCLECMNDWCVRARADVISIETLEVEWPESPVFHRWRSAWLGQTTYFVRFVRVWYRTSGVPRSDQRYVKGEGREPIDFPEQPIPDVNKEFRKYMESIDTVNGKDRAGRAGGLLANQLVSNSNVQMDYLWAFLHFAVLGFIAVASLKSAFL